MANTTTSLYVTSNKILSPSRLNRPQGTTTQMSKMAPHTDPADAAAAADPVTAMDSLSGRGKGNQYLRLCPSLVQSERQLKATVGETVSFPAQVTTQGFLKYRGTETMAAVINGQLMPVERFKGKVTWNSSTGHFHITQLNTQDSGEYGVQNTEGNVSDTTVFQLTVYNRVSKPQVFRRTQVSLLCSFLCSVSNGREVTLSWYREGEEKPLNHSSSPDLNTALILPLETEGLSHSYSCVATNPVSTERVTVNTEEHCFNNVSRPQVSNKTQVSAGSCPFLCSVANGREVTLSWYREGEEKPLNHCSSPDLSTPLTLPLETEGLSHSYSCVATNPISTERVTVNPGEHCLGTSAFEMTSAQ
ncbi:titin isoform X2 [Amia ocellicauda]|uniref:titin isoform X2 n=1 Tax=Amia ocellicauda TaxID=2972642 RepID=UPI0034641950